MSVLNTKQCYVYRYTDAKDSKIKYVGCVYGEKSNLVQRVTQHKQDYWFKKSKYIIQYLDIEIESRTDAEYLEAHFINLYKTYKYFNIAKKNWGISKFIPDYDDQWKILESDDYIKRSNELLQRLALSNSINILEDQLNDMKKLLYKLENLETQRDILQKHIEDEYPTTSLHYKREGRPKKYSNELLEHASILLNEFSYNEVATLTGISKSTLIRYSKNKTERTCENNTI